MLGLCLVLVQNVNHSLSIFYFLFFCSEREYPNIFGHLTAVLVGIVGANFQGKTKTLIETHSLNMWSFLVTIGIYFYAFSADGNSRRRQENSSQFWELIAVVSGTASAFSLASTLLPQNVGDIILYNTLIFYGITLVVLLVYHYGRIFMDASRQRYKEILVPIFSDICNCFQINDTSLTEQPRRPQV